MSAIGTTSRQKPKFRPIEGACERCGTPFTGRPDKRFCSDNCRTKGGREKKARQAVSARARITRAITELSAAVDAFVEE